MNMKNLSKKIAAFVLTTILAGTLSAPLPVQAAEWKKDGNGWRWQEDNGSYSTSEWKKINGKWYHFNASGYMDTGWYQKGIRWYYLGDANDGAMKTGWHQINGKWYCFADGDSGVMRSFWYTEGENLEHLELSKKPTADCFAVTSGMKCCKTGKLNVWGKSMRSPYILYVSSFGIFKNRIQIRRL